jgi:Cu2+-exporting ATPase
MAADFKRRFWISLILSLPILALAPMIQGWLGLTGKLAFPGDRYVQFALATAVFVYGGWPFLKGLVDELRKRAPGMMTLIAIAITVAFIYSAAVTFGLPGRTFYWELATLVVVMLLGHWVEMKSVMGASRALDELARLMPSVAHKQVEGNRTEDVKVSELNKGDKVIIKPGERIPVDGVIVDGSSTVDEAAVTGESRPVDKSTDDEVTGGTINGDGSLTVEIKSAGKDSYLSRVMKMVQEAQQSKSRTQRLADKAAFWLTVIALSVGAITFIAWYAFAGREFVFALERTVTVMVITCPHALGLAIPLVVAVATSLSARNGLLIRNWVQFERTRKTDAVLMDKTGTLTEGSFKISDVVVLDDQKEESEILKLAAAIESRSEHPIAKAIAGEVEDTPEVKDFEAIKGKGAVGKVDGQSVKVVSPGYLKENDRQVDNSDVDKLMDQGKTVVFVMVEDKVIGAIGLDDPVREQSKEAIRQLRELGIDTLMITGDNKQVAERIAGELGIDEYFAEILPDQKADKVKEIQKSGRSVAMVGDGVNDAPALAQADIGIAIGTGTDVAAETADVILVKSNPVDIVKLLRYSKATYRKMIQNLFWATGYNAIAIPLAAGVLAAYGILPSPAIGAILMSLSTVIVAINARILKVPTGD